MNQENPWADLADAHGGELADWLRVAACIASAAGLALIFLALRRCHRLGLDATAKWILLLGLGLLPAIALGAGTGAVMEAAKRPEKCMTCHIMEPYGRDMIDPKSDTLAAAHYRNRWIQRDQCYTCHSHYGIFGTVGAKLDGVGHLYHYVTGTYELPLRMKRPYPIHHCLQCHSQSDSFLKVEKHVEPQVVADLKSGKISCTECHEPPHPRRAAKQ
ncbi:MAG TPA: NapC/NirT family cytochrome c [Planctomycetota bacterium]|nr:NapC/NirT family cytochrome c [Planctomycetota bacterium]